MGRGSGEAARFVTRAYPGFTGPSASVPTATDGSRLFALLRPADHPHPDPAVGQLDLERQAPAQVDLTRGRLELLRGGHGDLTDGDDPHAGAQAGPVGRAAGDDPIDLERRGILGA